MLTFTYYIYTGLEFVTVRKDGIIIFDGLVSDWFDDDDE